MRKLVANVNGFQILLLLLIMILLLGAGLVPDQDQEQDQDHEQDYRSMAPAISTRESEPSS